MATTYDLLNKAGAWRGLIPKSDGVTDLIKKKYDTKDIQELIIFADAYNAERKFFKKLAFLLRGANRKETCANIYRFVRLNVKYVRDTLNNDTVKSAIATLEDGYGDCKVMTLLTGAILRELGIFYRIRFVAYDSTKQVTHVYLIATVDGLDVIIDCVYHYFNAQIPFNYFEDFYVFNEAAKINGIVTPNDTGGYSTFILLFFLGLGIYTWRKD